MGEARRRRSVDGGQPPTPKDTMALAMVALGLVGADRLSAWVGGPIHCGGLLWLAWIADRRIGPTWLPFSMTSHYVGLVLWVVVAVATKHWGPALATEGLGLSLYHYGCIALRRRQVRVHLPFHRLQLMDADRHRHRSTYTTVTGLVFVLAATFLASGFVQIVRR